MKNPNEILYRKCKHFEWKITQVVGIGEVHVPLCNAKEINLSGCGCGEKCIYFNDNEEKQNA